MRGLEKAAGTVRMGLGEGCLCGVPHEVISGVALDVQRRSGDPLLFLNGYVNGCDSYLPTGEEYDRGGYEVLWSNLFYYRCHGRVMPLNRDTAEGLAEEVLRLRRLARGCSEEGRDSGASEGASGQSVSRATIQA